MQVVGQYASTIIGHMILDKHYIKNCYKQLFVANYRLSRSMQILYGLNKLHRVVQFTWIYGYHKWRAQVLPNSNTSKVKIWWFAKCKLIKLLG